MSPLAKEVIEKLSHEDDNEVLAEVLDFYEYLKQKKQIQLKKQWEKIEEDEPNSNEIKLIEEYKNSKKEIVSFDDLVMELDLDDK